MEFLQFLLGSYMFDLQSHDLLIIIFSAGAVVCTLGWLKQTVNKISDKLTIIPIEISELKSSVNEIRNSLVKVEKSVDKLEYSFSFEKQNIIELTKKSVSSENDLNWIKSKLNKDF